MCAVSSPVPSMMGRRTLQMAIVGGELCGGGRDEAEDEQHQPFVPGAEEVQLVSDPHGQARFL